jgi:hypothetical protein
MKRQYLLFFSKILILLITFSFLDFRGKVFAQTQISGKVKDAKDEPVPGVSVLLKGTKIGTTTDLNGDFKLRTDSKQGVLVISSIGYTPQEINIDGQTEFIVKLIDDSKFLGEVVVTALGIKREEKSLGFRSSDHRCKCNCRCKNQ